MSSVFDPVTFPMNITLTLEYIGVLGDGGTPYDYTGDLSGNTEIEYDALTWNDVRDKPAWGDILNSNLTAHLQRYDREAKRHYWTIQTEELPDHETRIGDLETAFGGITVPATFDDLTDGSTNKAFTSTEKTKLSGIASGATANDTDANLKARANHTGTQTASTISDFDTAADARITAQKGQNSGLASLDSGGKLLTTQLPGLAITSTSTAASQVDMLALTTQEGDVVVRTDESKTYIKNAGTAGTMADWTQILSPTGGVTSFNGRTGAVSPASGDYSASDITTGVFGDGRIQQSNVTQHQAALSIASTQVTGTKTSAFISDFTEAAQDAVAGALSAEFSYNDGANTIGLRARSFSNTPSAPTIVTTAAAANGTQLSSTRDADVSYSVSVATTASIGGNSSGYTVLEIAATNSSTAGDWVEISRVGNAQALTLAITLQSVQTTYGCLVGKVPAGYYRRLRKVETGTVTTTYISGQETLL